MAEITIDGKLEGQEPIQTVKYLNEGKRIGTERIPIRTFDDHDMFVETERNEEKGTKGVFIAVIRKKNEETLEVDIRGVKIDIKIGGRQKLGRGTGLNPLWFHWESAPLISHQHCEIEWEGNEIVITDLDLLNGACLKLVSKGTPKPFTIASGEDHTRKPGDLGGQLGDVLARVRQLVKDFLS